MDCLFQFPETRFVKNALWRQWFHLLSEVVEVGRALLGGRYDHAAAELWDVKHSAETMQRILLKRGVDVCQAKQSVLCNNLERGYYDPQ